MPDTQRQRQNIDDHKEKINGKNTFGDPQPVYRLQ